MDNVESVYPTSPMQRGLLTESLYAAGPDPYRNQRTYEIAGDLAPATFRVAWEQVLERHAALRTHFVWEGLKQPVQVVHRRVVLPWSEEDWRGLAAAELEERWAHAVEDDRGRPLAFDTAPLVRLLLARTGERTWRLLWTYHHAVLDGWSMQLVLRDLLALYEAARRGLPAALPPPGSFRDYLLWLAHRDAAAAEAFWRQRLRGLEAPTLLAAPRRGPAFAEETVAIPALGTALQVAARGERVTPSTFVEAAWSAVLSARSGRADLVFGSVVAGRPATLPAAAETVGVFSNVLPARVSLRPGETVAELLRRLQGEQAAAREHDQVFLGDVQHWSDLPPGEPLFDTLLAFQSYPRLAESGAPREGGIAIADTSPPERTGYPLAWNVWLDEALHVRALFDPARLAPGEVRRFTAELVRVLEQMMAHPEHRVDELDLLGEAERRRVLVEWNRPARWAADACLDELFAARAAERPDAVAVGMGDARLTYGELERCGNRLARHLVRLGVGPEVPVALCLERGLGMVVAVLAVLKAGGAYVPLEPDAPPERTAFQLADARVAVVVTEEALRARFAGWRGPRVSLDGDAGELARLSDHVVPRERLPESAAYVIYTSGSTGRPKGVAIPHGNVVRLFHATERALGLGAADVWTLFHSYAFDFSVWELWGALLEGGRLVVVPYWESRSPEAVAGLLAREGVTVLNQTPSAFRQLMAVEVGENDLPSLRLVVFGGEALAPATLSAWAAGHPQTRLVNMYGITEGTVHVTLRTLGRDDLDDLVEAGGASPIGERLGDLQTFVLDPRRRPVAVGVDGELWIGGPGLARGYVGRPELTAERFGPHPFGPAGARLYRTGDLVRWRDDGSLDFRGRTDEQVKIRGHRIEPGEVCSALAAHPAVAQAAVVAREDRPGQKRLVAYVVGRGERAGIEAAIGAEELRRHLRRTLPEPMIPAAFVVLNALPLTANGKLDRKALPAPGEDDARWASRTPRLPQTATEERLAAIWADVLGCRPPGLDDNFFALGGDSMLAVQVCARARREGLALGVEAIFQHPTLADLALSLDDREPRDTPEVGPKTASLVSAEDFRRLPADIEDAYPLSHLQLGMLFHGEYAPEAPLYHDVHSYHLRTSHSVAGLRAAIARAVARHAVLRTAFDLTSYSEPLQLVHVRVETPFALADLRGLGAAEQEREVAALFRAEKAHRFDWRRAPLCRFHLARRGPDSLQLTFTHHHAILDGWSVATLLTELVQDWQQGRRGETRPAPLAFRDFVAVERELLRSPAAARFWEETLAGAPEHPAWLTPRGSDQREIAVADHAVPRETTARLAALARELGVPLKSVLLAAHLQVVQRLAGGSDGVTGLVVNGRPEEAGGDAVLGLFLNAVPLRFRLARGTWREAVREAFAAERELVPYRAYPIAAMQKLTRRARLFATGFNFVHFRVFLELAGLDTLEVLAAESFEQADTAFAAVFALDPFSGDLRLHLQHDPGVLGRPEARALADTYGCFLAALAERPDAPVRADDAWTPEQKAALVAGAAARPWRAASALHEIFAEWARRAPARTALVDGDRQWSYGDLALRVLRLAGDLRRLGVGPEKRVAVGLERSGEQVIATLAVLLAGGVYVPLDPDAVAERTDLMLADCLPAVIVTEDRERWEGRGAALLSVRAQEDAVGEPVLPALPTLVTPEQAAYVIYTSGSTGAPKGVVVTHAGLRNVALAQAELFGFGAGIRVLQLVSVAFDAAVSDWATVFASGATLVLAPHRAFQSLETIGELLERHHIHSVAMPPGVLARLPAERFPQLEIAIVGGEPAPAGLAERWGDGRRLLNAYGPTEATITVSVGEVEEVERDGASIGRPIANVEAYVLDAEMELLPAGVPGELWVGGAGVARGYLGRPDRTAERFVPDPLAAAGRAGARLYRTGDRARRRADGGFDLLGRLDEQVKIRGYRIEPGEVRAVLESHPAVTEAAIVAREDRPGQRLLVAYVVGHGGGEVEIEALRRHLRERLPEPMVPAAWVAMDALPRNAHGKIDRQALPAPTGPRSSGTSESGGPPRTAIERRVAAVWEEVLGCGPVGIEDNFFVLGGDSLSATQVISRLRGRLAAAIELRALFEALDLAEFAAAVERAAGGARPPLHRLPPAPSTPLSFAQQRLWFVERLQPGSGAYHMALALRLRGPLDGPAFARSLDEVARRHESLRTRFVEEGGEVVQRIDAPRPGLLTTLDLRGLPEAARESEILVRAHEQVGMPFDLAHGPLLRAELLRLAAEEHAVLLTLHHIVSDGWSMGVLVREVTALYEAFSAGLPSPLKEPLFQYADYAVWQRRWLAGGELEHQLDYWRERLKDLPTLALPLDRPRPAAASHHGAREPVRLGALAPALGERWRDGGVTLFMFLLAAWTTVLWRAGGERRVVVGTDVANRTLPELEGMIGFFVNQLVLLSEVLPGTSFFDLVGAVRETALAAYRHQDVPFERVVEAVAPERHLGRAPLFQVKLVLQNLPAVSGAAGVAGTAGSLDLSPIDLPTPTAVYDLLLNLEEREGGTVAGALVYRTDLFDRSTVRRMMDQLARVIAGALASPERSLDELDLLGPGERRQVLVEWNRTERAWPEALPVHERFAARARERPDVVALVTADGVGGEVTYGELARRAHRLGRHLAALGVDPEVRVALALERGIDLVVAILGVLTAGGAYVPLDPEAPLERAAAMIEDSGAAVVLTEESLRERLPVTWAQVVCLDGADAALAGEPEGELTGGAGPESAAYVIYTSGSTGRPKGVVVRHGGLTNLAAAQVEAFGIGPESRALQFAPAWFDASVSEWTTALVAGAALVVATRDEILPGGPLEATVARQQVSVLTLPPSVLARMAEVAEVAEGGLATVSTLVSAGEAWRQELAGRWLAGRRLLDAYGPTEATVCAAWGEIADGASASGRPLANARTYVLDGRMEPEPVGVVGELWVGGAGVARGYAGRPDLTAERFVPDPFGGTAGSRLYRTGDRARWRADGSLQYLGRLDDQVKIRGQRIEPAEVAAVLARDSAVAEAAVVAAVAAGGKGPGRSAWWPTSCRGAVGSSTPASCAPGCASGCRRR